MTKFFETRIFSWKTYSLLGLTLIISGCSIGNLGNTTKSTKSLAISQQPSSSAYSAAVLALQPIFEFLSGSLLESSNSSSVSLAAYSDNNCSTAAAGFLSASQNPIVATGGIATFASVKYTLPGHLEETIYLGASSTNLSRCSLPLKVLHRFNSPSGFVQAAAGVTNANGNNSDSWITSGWGVWGPAMQIDSSGRYVVVSNTSNGAGGFELTLWRYFPDGTLDTSFGNGQADAGPVPGSVVTGTTGAAGGVNANEYEWPTAMKIDSQNRIIVVGLSGAVAAGNWEAAIWRFNSDGSLDSTFGAGQLDAGVYAGSVVTGVTSAGGAGIDYGNAIEIDSSGRYVIAGSTTISGGGYGPLLLRFNSNGSLDSTFGSTLPVAAGCTGFCKGSYAGSIITVVRATDGISTSRNDVLFDLKIDSQDRITSVGFATGTLGWSIYLLRLNSDGTADSNFGSTLPANAACGLGACRGFYAGAVLGGTTNAAGATTGQNEVASTLTIDSQNRLIISGISSTTNNADYDISLALWRFNSDGTLDSTFGATLPSGGGCSGACKGSYAGSVVVAATAGAPANMLDTGASLQIDSQGRYVVGGNSHTTFATRTPFADGSVVSLWRFNSDGTLDSTFGSTLPVGGACVGYACQGAYAGSVIGGPTGIAGGVGVHEWDGITKLQIDSSGRIITVGYTNNGADNADIFISRYKSNGTLDQ